MDQELFSSPTGQKEWQPRMGSRDPQIVGLQDPRPCKKELSKLNSFPDTSKGLTGEELECLGRPRHILCYWLLIQSQATVCYASPNFRSTGGSEPQVRRRIAIAMDCRNSLERGTRNANIRLDTNLQCYLTNYNLSMIFRMLH